MEMSSNKGSAASPRESTKPERSSKPKLEPEIVRTMRDREAVRTAVIVIARLAHSL